MKQENNHQVIAQAKVIAITKLNHNVIQIILNSAVTIKFFSGQYVGLKFSSFDFFPFSIANKSGSKNLEFHLSLKKNNKFNDFIANKLQVNDVVQITKPCGNFYLHNSPNNLLFIAGGTGIAPIKAIIEEFIANKDSRNITLYWGVETKADLYLQIPEKWQKLGVKYIPVLSLNNKALDSWSGRCGLVHTAPLIDINNFNNYDVYICGPMAMVQACATKFVKQGLKKENFYNDIITLT